MAQLHGRAQQVRNDLVQHTARLRGHEQGAEESVSSVAVEIRQNVSFYPLLPVEPSKMIVLQPAISIPWLGWRVRRPVLHTADRENRVRQVRVQPQSQRWFCPRGGLRCDDPLDIR